MTRLLHGFLDELEKVGYDLSPSALNQMHKTLVRVNKEFMKATKDVSNSAIGILGGGEPEKPAEQSVPKAPVTPEVGAVNE